MSGSDFVPVSRRPRWLGSRFAVVAFVCWLLFGATASITNLRAYALQQIGVDAIVEHGTLTLGHSPDASLQPLGDTFIHEGRVFAAKQPGQFALGAPVYAVLRVAGIDYSGDYDQASALVTWLSVGLAAALAVALFDHFLRTCLAFSSRAAALATASFGVASPWLAYAGIAHHDVLATAMLVAAAWVYGRSWSNVHASSESDAAPAARAESSRRIAACAVAAGLLGSVSFVSLLAIPLAAIALALMLWHAKRGRIAMIACFGVGLVPAAAYHFWFFGSPFLPANVAGNFTDTFPRVEWALIRGHLDAYFGSGGIALWRYMPAAALGLAGLALARGRAGVRRTAALLLAAHVAYLVCIPTLGTCQFGPRYLLPVLPIFALGVAAVAERFPGRAMTRIIVVAIAAGFVINAIGAVGGTMDCDLSRWSFPSRLALLEQRFEPAWLPLRYIVAVLAVLLVAMSAVRLCGLQRTKG